MKYTDPSAQLPKELSYKTKVVGTVPRGARIKLEPEFKDGKVVGIKKSSFRVLQEAQECPPALEEIETTVAPYIEGVDVQCTLTTSGYSYYVIFDNSSYIPNNIIYQKWIHTDQVWECDSGAYNSISFDTIIVENSCTIAQGPSPSPTPSPSPSPEETPEPPTPEPTVAPTAPPATQPPVIPPTAPPTNPPTEPPTPEPTPTPTPDPKLTLDHAVISPDGDGKEDDSPAHVEATGGWKVEVSGGTLTQPLLVAGGSDDGSFTWTGKAGNTELPDGNYTLTLTELGTSKTVQVPAILKTALEIKAQYEAFSPNFDPKSGEGDGRFDFNELSVRCAGRWTVTAGGALIAEGKGSGKVNWDGRPNGRGKVLPDGEYKLLLTRISDSKEAETVVTIDTLGPEFTLAIDGVAVAGANGGIQGNVAPEIKLDIVDNLTGVEKKEDVNVRFSRRRDGITPVVDDEFLSFTAENLTSTYLYRVPLRKNALLYFGDQWIDVTMRDRTGNESNKRVSFAVGSRSLYSGGAASNAYHIAAVDTPTKTYPLPEKFAGFVVESVPAYLIEGTPKTPQAPPPNYFVYLVRSTLVGGAATIVFFDEEIKDAIEYYTTKAYKVKTEFGNVYVSKRSISHAVNGHPEVDSTLIMDSVCTLTAPSRYRGRFEYWSNPTPPSDLVEQSMIVYKYGPVLFATHLQLAKNLQPDSPGLQFKTMYGFSFPKKATGLIPDPLRQWSDVATDVARFMKREHPEAPWSISNPTPRYSKHRNGVIDDDGVKPYNVIYEVRAQARVDRRIIDPNAKK